MRKRTTEMKNNRSASAVNAEIQAHVSKELRIC